MHGLQFETAAPERVALKLSSTFSAKHVMRVLRTLQVWSAAVLWVPLLFALLFAARGEWRQAAFELPIAAIGLTGWLLCRHGRLQTAAAVLGVGMFIAIWVLAALVDLPSASAPRTVHHYFMVLGVGLLLMFRNTNFLLSTVLPLASLASTMFFSATTWGIVSPLAVPDDVRQAGAWIHTTLAISMILALMWVMQSDFTGQRALTRELAKALGARQLELYYQPQVHASGEVVGAEALLRWHHPELGMVSPAEFIPLAERSGLILPIGRWVLDSACSQLAVWQQLPAMSELVLAVNVSAVQFRQAEFVSGVVSALEHHRVEPGRLKLELTESMLASDLNDMVQKMGQLKGCGVGLSLDDFGTGYSSLGYLRRLPLDQIKIDASFVREILTNAHDAAIARTVVALARDLELEVIAEGVETELQREFLLSLGCENFQGYLFSPPLPLAKFTLAINASRIATRSNWGLLADQSRPLPLPV